MSRKVCIHCKKNKLVDEFYWYRGKPRSSCKVCHVARCNKKDRPIVSNKTYRSKSNVIKDCQRIMEWAKSEL